MSTILWTIMSHMEADNCMRSLWDQTSDALMQSDKASQKVG